MITLSPKPRGRPSFPIVMRLSEVTERKQGRAVALNPAVLKLGRRLCSGFTEDCSLPTVEINSSSSSHIWMTSFRFPSSSSYHDPQLQSSSVLVAQQPVPSKVRSLFVQHNSYLADLPSYILELPLHSHHITSSLI